MQVATMGGTATGALLWGQVATWSSVSVAVTATALVAPLLLPMARWTVRVPCDEDVQPSPHRSLSPPHSRSIRWQVPCW